MLTGVTGTFLALMYFLKLLTLIAVIFLRDFLLGLNAAEVVAMSACTGRSISVETCQVQEQEGMLPFTLTAASLLPDL